MPYTLSPTSLNLMHDCPRCFWLELNKGIKRPCGIFPSLPSGMDRVLKTHFDCFRDKGKLPPELVKAGVDAALFSDKELLDEWRNYRKGLRFEDSEGNVLKGMVDNVLEKGGKLIVLDYKTRGFPIKEDSHSYYQLQMDVYTFLIQKAGFQTEDYAYLLFYHPDKVSENGEVVFHTDLVKVGVDANNAEKVFKEAIEMLKGEMPEGTPGCEYCGLRE